MSKRLPDDIASQLTLETGTTSRVREESAPKGVGPELVVALVGAVGTDTALVTDIIEEKLSAFGYRAERVHLIQLLRQIDKWHALPDQPVDERYRSHMDAGNEFRKLLRRRDAVALLGVAYIRRLREKLTGDGNRPSPRTAYVLRSIKKRKELEALRRIYGGNLIVISAYSPEEARVRHLATKIAMSRGADRSSDVELAARELVKRDQQEAENTFGQNVRGAFPQADFFVNADEPENARKEIQRVLELVFGTDFHTPTREEYGMFLAHAAAMRSAALARQVGAAICLADGTVAALGCNDVPKAGGGLYWTGDAGDKRDHVLGYDSNDSVKRQLFQDVLARLKNQGWLSPDKGALSDADLLSAAMKVPDLAGTKLMDVMEYGRAVHAEMAALTDAVRRGVAVAECTLFSTTFPCHNCAKHLIAAGIRKVFYIEPYPKSFVPDLYPDSTSIDAARPAEGTVQFRPYVGVSPRRYLELFSMIGTPRKHQGKVLARSKSLARPRTATSPHAYLVSEQRSISELNGLLKTNKLATVTKEELART